jgi:hypothetical protein
VNNTRSGFAIVINAAGKLLSTIFSKLFYLFNRKREKHDVIVLIAFNDLHRALAEFNQPVRTILSE